MLQRIYGTAFFTQAELDEHLRLLEEARKRDHRRLGSELDLFMFHPFAPGAAFWTERGTTVFNVLNAYMREIQRDDYRRDQDAPPVQPEAVGALRALGEVPRQHVPRPRRRNG